MKPRHLVTVSFLLLLAARPLAVPAQTPLTNQFTVDVAVNTTWTDTGILVAAGDSLIISAVGTLASGAADWEGWFGPEGMTRGPAGGCTACPLPGYPGGALIARIDTGSPFYVGPFLSFACQTGGVLYLGVNDDAPASYAGTLRAFVWGGAPVPPPPVIDCVGAGCGSYINLGTISGDTGGSSVAYFANGDKWLRIYISENESSGTTCVGLRALFRLTPPTGADYDLYVYCDACNGSGASSTQGGSAVEEVFMAWDEDCVWPGIPSGTDSSRYLYVHVRCYSVSIENDWTLQVFGNTGSGSNTCSTK
jgi:hypothetical protein